MDIVGFLIGALVLTGAGFLFQRSKRQSAEALNQNLDTKEDLLNKSKQQGDLQAKSEIEKLLRTLIEEQSKDAKDKPVNPKDFE